VATREVDALPWPALLARLRRLAHDAEALGEVATVLQDLERRYGQAEARKEELGRRRRELLALRRRVHAARTAGEGGQEAIQARLLAGGGYTRF
jgi:hypothetical protein